MNKLYIVAISNVLCYDAIVIYLSLNIKLEGMSKELILEIKKSDEDKLNKLVIRIFDVNNEEDIYKILN